MITFKANSTRIGRLILDQITMQHLNFSMIGSESLGGVFFLSS